MKRISSSFFNVPKSRTDVKKGDLLVAEPFMHDKWFGRSIIALFDHDNEKGSAGLVLNNELDTTLSEIFSDVHTQGLKVYCGGPMGHDRLFFLHTLGDKIFPDAQEISPGLWMGGRFASAVEYLNAGYPYEGHIRFFVGYSGWSENQLKDEIENGAWAVPEKHFEASSLLEGEGNVYWKKIISQMGDKYRNWTLVPEDARAN